MGLYHDLTFPNETPDYRAARDALLGAEIELRRQAEKVSALRRALPPGGALKEDYVFQNLSGEDVQLSALFSGKSRNLLIYGFMYKPGGDACPDRDPGQRRLVEAGAARLLQRRSEDLRPRIPRLGVSRAPGGRGGSIQRGVLRHP